MREKLQSPLWPKALEQARLGELALADEAWPADQAACAGKLIYARCLTEAGSRLDEALALLAEVEQADAGNPLLPHIQALAYARRNAGTDDLKRAAGLWRKFHLPHDMDLLGQTAFTLEAQWAPLELPKNAERTWPENLPHPAPIAPSNPEESAEEPRDNLAPDAPKSSAPAPVAGKRKIPARTLRRIDDAVNEHRPLEALSLAAEALGRGEETSMLHLLAGAAAEEAGQWELGRAYLTRALELDPAQLHARMMLGRIYWRLEWVDLALALWRSLPVEGPYDTMRHYHLALGHAARGERAAANMAMNVALRDFFFDTRHGFIERAWALWKIGHGFAETVAD